jgi:hypothetical protein
VGKRIVDTWRADGFVILPAYRPKIWRRPWAKYTSATDYDQNLHRDYLNQTVAVAGRGCRTRLPDGWCGRRSPPPLRRGGG